MIPFPDLVSWQCAWTHLNFQLHFSIHSKQLQHPAAAHLTPRAWQRQRYRTCVRTQQTHPERAASLRCWIRSQQDRACSCSKGRSLQSIPERFPAQPAHLQELKMFDKLKRKQCTPCLPSKTSSMVGSMRRTTPSLSLRAATTPF